MYAVSATVERFSGSHWDDLVVSNEEAYKPVPSKHETLTQCCFDVSPPSLTSAQHQNNIGSLSRVFWADTSLPENHTGTAEQIMMPAMMSR